MRELQTATGTVGEGWTPVRVEQVIASFLRGEAHRFETIGYSLSEDERRVIEAPNLDSAEDNHARMRLLFSTLRRGAIFARVPDDTDWYEVRLHESDLDRLLVLPVMNLMHVASRELIPLKDPPEVWEKPILWGHAESGPFTILEGNRRMIAYVQAAERPPLDIAAFVGLSDRSCRWHLPDWYKIQR